MTREEILGAIARGWCHPANSHKDVDEVLAFAIADEVQKALAQPKQSEPVAWLSESGAWVTTSKAMFEHESAKGKVMTPLYK